MSTVAGKTRVVSARALSRQWSSLLDEIEREGSALIVVRYGRPSAVVLPFEETRRALKLPRISDLEGLSFIGEPEVDVGLEDFALDEPQISIILGIAHCPYLNWTASQARLPAPVTAMSLTRLEHGGLIERSSGAAWRLTRAGTQIAVKLDSNP